MPRSDWEQTIEEYLKIKGWRVFHQRPGMMRSGKWVSAGTADSKGFVDFVAVRERIVFVEGKTRYDKLTREQECWRDAIRKAGGEWHCFRPQDRDEMERILA